MIEEHIRVQVQVNIKNITHDGDHHHLGVSPVCQKHLVMQWIDKIFNMAL